MRHKGLLGWRYDSRCNYMITLVTEPRTSIFGTLREWGVERSEEGRAVYEAWQAVEAKFPGVRATYNAIMPDLPKGNFIARSNTCSRMRSAAG